jgi:hypothetical protein
MSNYNDVFTKLQDYILNDSTMAKSFHLLPTNHKYVGRKPDRQIVVSQQKPLAIFEPREKDSLFWCFYIMKNGQTAYDMLEHRNFILEKKLKIEYVEKMRLDKEQIKLHKFSTLTHLESNLANDDRIDISVFLSLCVAENLNVVIVKKRTYFELLMNDSAELHIIYCLDNYKHGYTQICPDKPALLKLDNIVKPLKSISSYKVGELTDMCEKLQISITNDKTCKAKTKNELYESIAQCL